MYKRILYSAAVVTLIITPLAFATDYTWTNGGGNNAWDTTSANWTIGAGNTTWVDGNGAILGPGGAAAITVSGNRTVTGLVANANGYSLTGGQITVSTAFFTISSNLTISSILGGNGLIKTDAGILTLTGSNTFSGGTTLIGGSVVASHVAALGTGGVTLNGGTLDLQTDSSINPFNISQNSGYSGTVIVNRATPGPAVNHILGVLSAGSGGNYSFTQGTNVTSGSPTLTFSSFGVSGGTSANATLNANSVNLVLTSATAVPNGNGTSKTLVFSGTSTGNRVTGGISNGVAASVNVTKTGTGTWILDGTNTYTGPTLINAGTLELNGAWSGDTLVTVMSNATLGGTATLSNVTCLAGSTLQPASSNSVGTLTLGNSGTLGLTNVTLSLNVDATGNSDVLAVNGNLVMTNCVLNVTETNSLNYSKKYTFMTWTGTGTISPFAITNIPPRWFVVTETNKLQLVGTPPGTVILIH